MSRKLSDGRLLLCQRIAGSAQKHRDDTGVSYCERACEFHRGLEQQGSAGALNATNSRVAPRVNDEPSCKVCSEKKLSAQQQERRDKRDSCRVRQSHDLQIHIVAVERGEGSVRHLQKSTVMGMVWF